MSTCTFTAKWCDRVVTLDFQYEAVQHIKVKVTLGPVKKWLDATKGHMAHYLTLGAPARKWAS